MKVLAPVLPAISLLFALYGLWAVMKRREPAWQTAVYLPGGLFFFGLLVSLAAVPAAVQLWRGKPAGFWLGALATAGWGIELACANCWVRFDEVRFTHHTFFGRTFEFTYRDVTGIRYLQREDLYSDVRLYCGRHTIFLDKMSRNLDPFLRRVERKSKHMELLPDRIRWDPYDHRVPHGKFVFAVLLAAVLLMTAALPFVLHSVFGPPDSEDNTQRREAIFVSWRESDKGTLYLTASDGADYGTERWVRASVEPDALCDGETPCTVWGKGREIFWIRQLRAGERTVFNFEEFHEAYRQDQKWAIPFVFLLWAAAVWTFVMMLRVSRHPERYSPRFRGLFIREP